MIKSSSVDLLVFGFGISMMLGYPWYKMVSFWTGRMVMIYAPLYTSLVISTRDKRICDWVMGPLETINSLGPMYSVRQLLRRSRCSSPGERCRSIFSNTTGGEIKNK